MDGDEITAVKPFPIWKSDLALVSPRIHRALLHNTTTIHYLPRLLHGAPLPLTFSVLITTEQFAHPHTPTCWASFMPVQMRAAFHKAEAKYNVTTEFPNLGLHAAAATGNVGLVEYALNNGQPINSVLDGVLPLHAACAGGNVQVVKLLIDHGADVNAPRLPRKYSLDKGRDTSAPIVGSSGSTPLHFAAANGNTDVVLLLLLHGAHPNRADKHGVTPEMLATQSGWVECAKVLQDWVINKDRDLREREPGPRYNVETQSQFSPSRRRLHVKQSIDTALNMLKTPDHFKSQHIVTPPASPQRPFGEYTFYPPDPASAPVESGLRRPSLPHILQPHSADPERPRKNSTATTTDGKTRQRRPRSAGTDADQANEPEQIHPVYGRGGAGRKLHSKYSLLNIFKKGQQGGAQEDTDAPENNAALQASTVTLPISMKSSRSTPMFNADLPDSPGTPSSLPSRTTFQPRVSDASTKGRFSPQTQSPSNIARKPSGNLQTPPRANMPLAVELHLALAQQHQRGKSNEAIEDPEKHKSTSPLAKLNALLSPSHNRHRSGSASSMPAPETRPILDDDAGLSHTATPESDGSKPSPSPRAGILRAHNRTNSSGQGGSPLNPRNLRFDSTSSTPDRRGKNSPRTTGPELRSYSSVGSLTKLNTQTSADRSRVEHSSIMESPPLGHPNGESDVGDHPDEYYGQPIHGVESSLGGGSDVLSVLLQRQRGNSFASSSESSLSPILSNDNANDPEMVALSADFPFSINRPPSLVVDEEPTEKVPPSPGHLNVPHAATDTRGRGDSMSSTSTTDSRMSNALMSSGTTSGSGGSATVSTPSMGNILTLSPGSTKSLDTGKSRMRDLPTIDFEEHESFSPPAANNVVHLSDKRGKAPLDIDITTISSHAQAEELVQRTRQEVLEVANENGEEDPDLGTGRTPLSARLAAYGEILALERKLREQKEEQEAGKEDNLPASSPPTGQFLSPAPPPRARRDKSGEGVERQLSLEAKANVHDKARRRKEPRRPSTADGMSGNRDGVFFGERLPSHHSSLSAGSSAHPAVVLSHEPESYSPSGSEDQDISTSYNEIDDRLLSGVDYRTPPARPRTPILLPDDSLSRMNSSDADTETGTTPVLHRGATVPLGSIRNQRTENMRSQKKLTRMGIPVTNQAAATAGRTASTPATPPSSGPKRYVKSLMQTLKGKT